MILEKGPGPEDVYWSKAIRRGGAVLAEAFGCWPHPFVLPKFCALPDPVTGVARLVVLPESLDSAQGTFLLLLDGAPISRGSAGEVGAMAKAKLGSLGPKQHFRWAELVEDM